MAYPYTPLWIAYYPHSKNNNLIRQLLMPADLIQDEYLDDKLDHSTDDEIIKELASIFKVSQIAMSYRLMNLGYINYR